jgi:large subunit ribosomal protein L5
MSRLHEKYRSEIAPSLMKEFGYGNVHQIPKVSKVVINTGVGRAVADSKHLDSTAEILKKIASQAPVKTRAKRSVAGFKLRQGHQIGAMVTLRGERMYDFLDRLVAIGLPRVRDFRGISRGSFDPSGNYSLGIREVSIFPELSFEESDRAGGLQVNITTTAKSPEEGLRLLELMGFPFRRNA